MKSDNNFKNASKSAGTWLSQLALVLLFTFAVFGCDQDGPVEEAGESVDEAVSDTKRAVEDAVD